MTAVTLILVAPCSLLLGAVLQLLVARLCSAKAKGVLAVLFCVPSLLAVIATAPHVFAGQSIDFTIQQWNLPTLLSIHVDALSVFFALMGTGIGGFVLVYSVGYMAHDNSATRFYATMLVFIAGFVGLVYCANLFTLYGCWEVVGLCSFSLVGFWYTNAEAVKGARKVLLMTHIAGYGLLAAILIIYHRTGSALWTDPKVAQAFTGGVFVLMLIALVAKSVQVPLHTWIPEAMAAPTPVSALLHAACYVKAGVYLAARMHSFGAWPAAWGATLVWIGTITMAVGVMYAMVQSDLKRMLAYSTVSQIGYMMMGLGIGTPLAITAGLLHCLNHGFFKGGLFLTAGSVQHAAGTRDMNQLGGLAARMPRTTLSWLIGVGSMMGIPLMSGFASKWMLYAAALESGWAVSAMIAWAASLGTVFMGVKATSAVFLGPPTDNTSEAHESPASMLWGMGLLAAGSIILGIAPQLAVNFLLNPILRTMALGAGVHVTWLGLSSDAGSFSTTGGLVLALVSVVLGGAVYALSHAARPVAATAAGGAALAGAAGGVFTGGEPLSSRARLTAGDFSDIFLHNWHSFFRWTNVDRAYLALWAGLEATSRVLSTAIARMERRALLLLLILEPVTFVVFAWVWPEAPTATRAATESHHAPLVLIVAIALAAVALFFASLRKVAEHGPALWFCMLAVGGLCAGGLAASNPWLRLGLLELAALMTVMRVWFTARSKAAKLTYLAVVLLSAASAIGSELLITSNQNWSRALLLTGTLIKLAAVPLLFWLLSLADELPALVLGLVIAVVDMAAFGEFWMASQMNSALLTPSSLILGIAAATSLLAALLMLTQRSLKRLLVLSTIEDAGFLLLGLTCATPLSTSGAIIAASTHALAKALLFACLSVPEADGALAGSPAALAARYPMSAFGFLFGMLAMLGIPPTLGFLGRWRLYQSALEISPLLLALFVISSILALVAYVLALTRTWWGPPPDAHLSENSATREPLALRSAIVLLVSVLLISGLWPNLLVLLEWGRL
ncbi:proton-conducting transporter membrane subunit [Occallatibacter savannae]|uniref:proton-conducting transporter transmembrane domain-containing protein n=1 Tax=Occallatibacter savannae TaxID=1002691 RepID=UPI000D69FE67|nr:proton-conducting transporter membrane subunit [Occallatibacter savannae]